MGRHERRRTPPTARENVYQDLILAPDGDSHRLPATDRANIKAISDGRHAWREVSGRSRDGERRVLVADGDLIEGVGEA